MDCETCQALLMGDLGEALGEEDRRRLAEHLATCDGCHAESEELRAVWNALGAWPEASPPAGLAARVRSALESHDSEEEQMRSMAEEQTWTMAPSWLGVSQRALIAVAVLVVLAAGGAFVVLSLLGQGGESKDEGVSIAAGEKQRYMLLLLEDPTVDRAMTDSDRRAVVEEYKAWARTMRDSGSLIGGDKLADDRQIVLTRGDATETDLQSVGPGGGLVLGGYFVVLAASYDEAVKIARTCPHLLRGGTIEVRRIEEV